MVHSHLSEVSGFVVNSDIILIKSLVTRSRGRYIPADFKAMESDRAVPAVAATGAKVKAANKGPTATKGRISISPCAPQPPAAAAAAASPVYEAPAAPAPKGKRKVDDVVAPKLKELAARPQSRPKVSTGPVQPKNTGLASI